MASANLPHPNVKTLAQSNMDYITRAIRPRIDKSVGGGSTNMRWLLLVNRYFADAPTYRDDLVFALRDQEINGIFTFGPDSCEQGISTPHVELYLNLFSALYLDQVRKFAHEEGTEDTDLLTLSGRVFSALVGLASPITTPHGEVLMPGARQSENGPSSKVLDACIAVCRGKITKSPFRNLTRDTCAVTFLLEARTKAKLPDAFMPKLRWPLHVSALANGIIVTIDVPESDAPFMGKIGSGGIGTVEVRQQYSTRKLAWKTYLGEWHGILHPDLDLNATLK